MLNAEISAKTFVELNKQKKRKKKSSKKEEKLQIAIARFLKINYPDIIFNSDIASGMKLPIWIAARCKALRSERGQPDIVILEPNKKYKGICFELKKEKSDVYLKDGITFIGGEQGKHVLRQAKLLNRLREKGYWADFIFGFDEAINILEKYTNNQL